MIEEFGESQLKSFVAGDTMSFDRKYLSPIDARPTAKVMIATNTLPRFSDRTWGIWRRLLLVPFNKTISESQQIKTLATELKKELSGIFNWALAGLDRLNRQGQFTVPAEHAALLEDYRRDADPARSFLCERYTFSPNAYGVSTTEAYKSYRDWCATNGYQPLNEQHLGRQVKRIFPGCERKRPGARGEQKYIYTGLVVCEQSEVETVGELKHAT